jgi:hypothetical protein
MMIDNSNNNQNPILFLFFSFLLFFISFPFFILRGIGYAVSKVTQQGTDDGTASNKGTER